MDRSPGTEVEVRETSLNDKTKKCNVVKSVNMLMLRRTERTEFLDHFVCGYRS